jgi:hypothetical protein
VTARPLAVALTLEERHLLISLLFLGEELGADVDVTRPIAEMLDAALDLDDQTVREAFTSQSFFAESRALV